MTAVNTSAPDPSPPRQGVRLPLARPVVTYVLLGAIAVFFVLETVLGGSTSLVALEKLGAQVNSQVAGGACWRLLAAMFLHIGLTHIAFNGWALFSLGREVEAFYGSGRFTTIYLLSGLFGSLAYYLLGPDVLSAGASGAVFGLVGAEIAYLLRNRGLVGALGRQRLANLAVLVGVNLVLGFTIPGINNIAHLGGLISGAALGCALAPRYQVAWEFTATGPAPRLVDRMPRWRQAGAVLVVLVALVGGVALGNQRWAGSAAVLRQQAQAASSAGDLAQAQTLLERAIAADPTDAQSFFDLGWVHARQNDLPRAAGAFEAVLKLMPNQPDTRYVLGLVYADLGQPTDARAMLQGFLAQETSGERADHARSVLETLP
ncbi:MAG: hypothetical protein CVU38_01445 [Chloroflexi bacterium HGW-Chloroflexi-1]|nr:MAG: hypothetical protein CVU38_01445 [Chloroflexi bacterium HGW-Chloroflexi-1]